MPTFVTINTNDHHLVVAKWKSKVIRFSSCLSKSTT